MASPSPSVGGLVVVIFFFVFSDANGLRKRTPPMTTCQKPLRDTFLRHGNLTFLLYSLKDAGNAQDEARLY
jgi:hypothetical protein